MQENRLTQTLSLSGEWQIVIAGKAGTAQVPGVWEVQGYPPDVEAAIYRQTIDVPADWPDAESGAQIMLCFGAVSYQVTVTVNGIAVGSHEGLWTPFAFDVTRAIHLGASNQIELAITKPGSTIYPYRDVLVGFIPYVATTFGGPWQEVWLAAHRAPTFDQFQIAADPDTGLVKVLVTVSGTAQTLIAEISDAQGEIVTQATYPIHQNQVAFTLTVEQSALWSPTSPTCYTLTLRLINGRQVVSETARTFGFRRLQAKGDQLLLNGEPIFMRGILSWGWDPETLAPTPTDDKIRDEFRRVRGMGFNMLKLCLFVPPPRLFEIADEEGMLLWLELPMWWQRLSDHLRKQAATEYADIFARVHHHPSIVIYSLGCELGADMADAALLNTLNTLARRALSGVLVCDNSGSGEAYKGLDFDFADFSDYHFYCDLHQFVPLLDHFRRDWRPARPWLFGEFCDCDDYRDPDGLLVDQTYPWWRELFGVEGSLDRWAYRDQAQRMQALNLPFTHQQIGQISRQQSLFVRKIILERVRARHAIGGYVVTGLRDTPISTSGIFDDFGQPKYDAESFRQFNADAVLLLEVGRARAWTHGGDRPAPIDPFNHTAGASVSHRVIYAGPERGSGQLHWRLSDSANQMLDEGDIPTAERLPSGRTAQIAVLEWTAPSVSDRAEKLILTLELEGELGDLSNQWPMWIYPPPRSFPASMTIYDPGGQLESLGALPTHDFSVTAPMGILLSSVFTPEVETMVRAGGRLILLQSGGALAKPVSFWRESIKLLYDHPLLSAFPHDGYTDAQFYNLAADQALDMSRFNDAQISPIIRRLDARLFTVLDYLAEVQIGAGKMLACTLNFCTGTGDQVRGFEPNLAGRYLLSLMVAYLS